MPEVVFRVRWPGERTMQCYSPSRAITRFLDAGTVYPLDDFVRRSRAGLHEASERVRALYGFACSRAAAQIVEIEREAARHDASASVLVEAIDTAGSHRA